MSQESKQGISVKVLKGGPLLVNGLSQIKDADGKKIETKSTFALCRCGGSKNKPYCDGTHSAIQFSDERITDKPLDKKRAYKGKKITIYDNRTICSHAAFCIKGASEVFDAKAKPWINPDGAEIEHIIEVVEKCPSGALSYKVENSPEGVRKQSGEISLEKGGPYYFKGQFAFECEQQPPNSDQFALCRCGASKNKPFCDGTHYDVDFD